MTQYRYTECGLDNVIINGVTFLNDDNGEKVVCIPNINDLHRAIAESILVQKSSMSGKELRFLRTEIGLTQSQIADLVKREALAISRWERGENPIDSNAEAIIRLYAMETLKISYVVRDVIAWCTATAKKPQICIDGSDPSKYQPIETAPDLRSVVCAPRVHIKRRRKDGKKKKLQQAAVTTTAATAAPAVSKPK